MTCRMLSKWTILTLATALSALGCSPKGPSRQDLELLTATPWKYEKAGFGSDDDGVFDALDPLIAGCEKDNMVIFRKDGTGCLQGTLTCKIGGHDSLPFIWAFQKDSTIYFQDQYYKVRV